MEAVLPVALRRRFKAPDALIASLFEQELCEVPHHYYAGHSATSALWLCIIARFA